MAAYYKNQGKGLKKYWMNYMQNMDIVSIPFTAIPLKAWKELKKWMES